MGDRTYYSARVRKSDLPKFTKIMNQDEEEKTYEEALTCWEEVNEENDLSVEVGDTQMNYGGCLLSEQAAKAGCVLYGFHCSGGEYGPGGFIGVGGKFYSVAQDHYGNIVATLNDDGGVVAGEVENARAYLAAWKVVQKELEVMP